MADERRIFPTETVLALALGKKGAKVEEIASFVTGRPYENGPQAQAIAPFAIAWLARWQPKFMDIELDDESDWNNLVTRTKAALGDNISVMPMAGRLKAAMDEALDAMRETHEGMLRQADAAAKLEQQVRDLEALATEAKNQRKKNDELEARLKTMKTDMGALQRKANEYDGKLAIDNDELMQTIRDAIRDGLKGLAVSGAAATGAGAATAETGAAPAEPEADEDEFGFGATKKVDDEFGF